MIKIKSNNGFTLVEIIICIVLIGVIGTVSFIVINEQSTNDIKKLENKLLEAVSVFIEIEKDSDGVVYDEAIQNGNMGVEIPIKYLIDKGYYDQKDYDEILELKNLNNTKNYYVVALLNEDSCDTGEYYFSASWDTDSTKPIYLCKNYKKNENVDEGTILSKIIKEYEQKGSSDCQIGLDAGICSLKGVEKTIDNKVIYYYTGANQNNYLKIGDYLFYIVRTMEDGGIKLISVSTLTDDSNNFIFIGNTQSRTINVTYSDSTNNYITDKVYDSYSQNYKFVYEPSTKYGYPDSCARGTYECRKKGEQTVTNTKWDDSQLYNYEYVKSVGSKTGYNYEQMDTYSLPYLIYLEVKKWYDNLNSEINIDNYTIESLWCDNSFFSNSIEGKYTKCKIQNNNLKYKFGLLNLDEYYLIIHGGYSDTKIYNSYNYRQNFSLYDGNNNSDGTTNPLEYTYDFNKTTYYLHDPASASRASHYYYSSENIYIRPSIIIRDDLKVISGDGSKSNPYIIETLT